MTSTTIRTPSGRRSSTGTNPPGAWKSSWAWTGLPATPSRTGRRWSTIRPKQIWSSWTMPTWGSDSTRNSGRWRSIPKGKDRPWILLKMARPLAQGPLWEHLHRDFSDRLIVVATVDDLRLSEVQISRELSWERTAQDVFWELVHNPCVNALSHCAHVVISFGPAGAILLSRQEEKDQPAFQCSLFFDPKVIERMWEKDYPGGMVGYNTCLTAGLARQLMLSPGAARHPVRDPVRAGCHAHPAPGGLR